MYCKKLKKEAVSLDRAPYPGELGVKILQEISAEAWQMWLAHQTILINEYRLNPMDPKARTFLKEQMQQFLFADSDASLPKEYQPLP